MNTTTLRGVFPDPKPVHRKNFIKENVKQIKQMQGILQEAGIIQPKPSRDTRIKVQRPINARSRESTPPNKSQPNQNNQIPSLFNKFQTKPTNRQNMNLPKSKIDLKKKLKADRIDSIEVDQKFTSRGIQTEVTDDLNKLYETGVIRYPSPSVHKGRMTRRESPHLLKLGQGEPDDTLSQGVQSLDLEEKDFIRENIKNLKPKVAKHDSSKDPLQPPPGYQRGVLPKYLRERKDDEDIEETEPECPPGHVLLPEEERKETLRVLRQSYADRIQELNSMPVRNDTLRMKKRKMEIEEELKRIDGGIKVFQRPKVFVKINA